MYKAGLLIVFVFTVFIAKTQIIPFSLFTDNMVLQRDTKVPVWGTAVNCKTVTIEFNGQKKVAKVVNGKWMVKLSPMKANAAALDMHFTADNNKLVLHNIAIGEVWLASGQSNMERQLGLRRRQKPIINWESEAAAANYPSIREFSLPHNNNVTLPITSINAQWKICNPKNVIDFSAVGYFFAKQLHEKYNVPVGIIHSSWGGTPVEKWISKELLQSSPEFASIVEKYQEALISFPSRLAEYRVSKDSLYAKWLVDSALAITSKKTLPTKPMEPINPQLSGDCGGLYKTMIEPLIPYAIKGAIWYQGEANVGNAPLYAKLFPAMIKEWRSKWGREFPFLFVQLAPYKTNTPELREVQLYTALRTPKTAMVVTLDCGDSTDIHPANKKPVGERLALAASALAYGEKSLEYTGPIYKSFKTKDKEIEISFTHVGEGLTAKGSDTLTGFFISANGIDFLPASAIIKKNKIVVSATTIDRPTVVRYAFVKSASGNLCNKNGLPASPFRTDTPSYLQ